MAFVRELSVFTSEFGCLFNFDQMLIDNPPQSAATELKKGGVLPGNFFRGGY
jgi:hypothetical protein